MGVKEIIELSKARERGFMTDETYCLKVTSAIIALDSKDRLILAQIISTGADTEGEG